MKYFVFIFALLWVTVANAQTQIPQDFGGKLYRFKNGEKVDSALFLPRRDTLHTDSTMIAPGQLMYRLMDSLLYYRRGDAMTPLTIGSVSGFVPATRSINTTSPLQGGGNLSSDRTLSILNAAADGSTKGAATFLANDFNDNGSGLISIDYVNGAAPATGSSNYIQNQNIAAQSGANYWIAGTGRIGGSNLRVDFTGDATKFTTIESSSVDGIIRSSTNSGTRRPLSFDGSKYTFSNNNAGSFWMNIDNNAINITPQVNVTSINYDVIPPPVVGRPVQVNGRVSGHAAVQDSEFVVLSQLVGTISGDQPYIPFYATDNSLDASVMYQGDAPVEAPGKEIVVGKNPIVVGGSAARFAVSDSIVLDDKGYHSIGDYSVYSQTNDSSAVASFDIRPQLNGSLDWLHYVGVQSRPFLAGSGAIKDYWYGLESFGVHNGTGIVTSYAGIHIPDVVGSGPITTQYGLKIESQTKGGTNWGVHVSGTAPNYLAGNLGLGGTGTSSTLTLNGSASIRNITVTGTTTLGVVDYGCYVNNSANVTINLPDATTSFGRIYVISKVSNNAFTVTIDPNGAQTVGGSSTLVLNGFLELYSIQSDGSNWRIHSGNVADASTTVRGAVNISAQSFAGLKTFTSGMTTTSFRAAAVTVTGNTTLDATHYLVLANNSANITITLPAAASSIGVVYVIKKISNNAFTVSLDPNASENIEGTSTPISIGSYLESRVIQCDGTQWWVQ
jgi:hypothetical protein